MAKPSRFTDFADVVTLSKKGETVHALGGDDIVYGNSGDDTIYGDDGNDLIQAGGGDDIVQGGTGYDLTYGGAGADSFVFYESDDRDSTLSEIRDYKGGEGDKVYLADAKEVTVTNVISNGNAVTIVFDLLWESGNSESFSFTSPDGDLAIYINQVPAFEIL